MSYADTVSSSSSSSSSSKRAADALEERGGGFNDPRNEDEIYFDLPPIIANYSVENIVVLDNLPVVPLSKRSKLITAVLKKLKKVGVTPCPLTEFTAEALPEELRKSTSVPDGTCPSLIPGEEKGTTVACGEESRFGRFCKTHRTELVVSMPCTPKGKTKGYAFLELENPSAAEQTVRALQGVPLDKTHSIKANLATEVEGFVNAPDEFVPPETKDYEDPGDLLWFLKDLDGRDQYAIRYGNETEVRWSNPFGEDHEVVRKETNWTDGFIEWSPRGTYLATVHPQGVALWMGEEWYFRRFAHHNVKVIGFSPNEKYMVTFNNQEHDNPKDPQAIVVWDVRSGRRMRAFTMDKFHIVNQVPWPFFKWSHDDHFVARLGEDKLSVYKTPSMGLLDKKAIEVAGIKDFQWSPSDNIIAFWVPESGDKPANVTLMSIPERKIVGQKNLFNATNLSLHWHPSGDFLCVRAKRDAKGKKDAVTLEFFRLRDKGVPVQAIEIEDKVSAFAWEPNGDRFAIIVGGEPKIYSMNTKDGLGLQAELERQPVDMLEWSPLGRYLLMAGMGSNAVLQFWDVDKKSMMGEGEHFMMTDVNWDPTGRYVCSYVNHWRHSLENGFNVWDFQGKLVHRTARDKFWQMIWRPRPPTLLSADEQRQVKKRLKKEFAERFDEEDRVRAEQLSGEQLAERQEQRAFWDRYLQAKQDEYVAMHERIIDLIGYDPVNDPEMVYEEVEVEELISVTEVPFEG